MTTATTPLPDINSKAVARTGIDLVLKIADEWGLTRANLARLLGVRSTTTVDNWKRKPVDSLPVDTLERISYLMHIYRSLQQLFNSEQAMRWLESTNSADPFLGTPPLEYMLGGQVRHLLDTHRYLKAYASGGF